MTSVRILSPIGSLFAGDVAGFPDDVAEALIASGHAEAYATAAEIAVPIAAAALAAAPHASPSADSVSEEPNAPAATRTTEPSA